MDLTLPNKAEIPTKNHNNPMLSIPKAISSTQVQPTPKISRKNKVILIKVLSQFKLLLRKDLTISTPFIDRISSKSHSLKFVQF